MARKEVSGFTLIEILLVVIILAVIAGITIPNFSNSFHSIQLKRTVKDLAYTMRYAQSRAVTTNRLVRLEFDYDLRHYWLSEQVAEEEEGLLTRVTGRYGQTYDIPKGLVTEFDQQTCDFYPDGSIEKVRFYICQDEACQTISTKEQRGAVKVYEQKIE